MSGQTDTGQIDVAFDRLSELVRVKLQELINSKPKRIYDDPMVYIRRLEYELKVFKQSGYSGVILIIGDYIQWARTSGIVVGPGRGSAAGSLVVYLAGITTVDPIRFGLLFERFLNPDRISLPDIDTDFSSRDAVIGYLKERYGVNRIAKVGVPSLFKPRSAIDEFARVLKVDFDEAKRINKLVGDSETFDEAIQSVAELREYQDKYPELFQLARRALGYVRMSTTHPSAVILSDGPIGKVIPLQRSRGTTDELVTQWDGEELDKLGYVKLDILTIDNLAVINNTIKMVGIDITFESMPLDDKKALSGFERGETVGVFQFEEPKSINILRSINGITFDDVVMVNACIRPGLDVASLIAARNDPGLVDYNDVPALEPILSETYGVILYQEQVMKMCVDLAGFTMSEADGFRKIIAKTANQREEFSKEDKEKFRVGYLQRGNNPDMFDEVWDDILACQTYIFNKAHAVSYSHISYMDMYLKQYYPLQFLCAALQVRSRELYIDECRRVGIEVLTPDINHSDSNYSIQGDSIRLGLGNIKHVGNGKKIIDRRPYKDEFDFVDKVKPNKKMIVSLIYAGAFDGVESDRSDLAYRLAGIDHKPTLAELAREEKRALGFYLTHNPLADYQEELARCVTPDTLQPLYARVGGMVSKVHQHQAKTGLMAFIHLFTKDGEVEAVVWPSEYLANSRALVLDNIIIADGKKTERGNYAISNVRILNDQATS